MFMRSNGLIVLLFVFLLSFKGFGQENTRRDSLEQKLSSRVLSTKETIEALNELSWEFIDVDPSKAQQLARKSLGLLDKEKNVAQQAIAYHRLGIALYNRNKLDSARIALNNALSLAGQNENLLGSIYLGLGNTEADKGNYETSLEMYQKALRIYEKLNDMPQTAHVLSSIGALYINLRNYDKMYEYTIKALEYHRKAGMKSGIASNLANLGEYYIQKNDTAKVFESLSESQKLFHELHSYINESNVLSSIGDYYSIFFNQQDKAIEIYKQSLSLLKDGENNNLRTDFYRKITFAYYKKLDYKNALANMLKAAEYTDTSNIDYMRVNYYYLVYLYIGLKDDINASNTLDKYVELSDKVYQANQKKSFAEMDVKYQTEKKELKITSLEKERKFIIIVSILGGILLMSLVILFAARQKVLAHQKKIAEQQILQLEQEKKLVATQAILQGETTERVRLSKDLHDGLGGLLSVTKHKIASMKGSLTIPDDQVEVFNSALEMLDCSITELRRVAHNLMPESLMRYGLNSAINDFCNSIDKVNYHFYGVEKRLDDKLEVSAFRIVNELVNNALKHSNASTINVQLVQEHERISITIYDDGIGFDPKTIDRSKPGGLNNIESRVLSFNGRMDVFSAPAKGTEISVEFKLL